MTIRAAKWMLAALALGAGIAHAEDDVLPPEEAFPYSVSATDSAIELKFEVLDGYYLYKERFGFSTETPGIILGEAKFPKGKIYEDEWFGKMEIFRNDFVIEVPYRGSAPNDEMELALRLQGCADIGLCYPPQKWPTAVVLPASTAGGGGILGQVLGGGDSDSDILPPDEAFRIDARVIDANTLGVSWTIEPGYYLYRSEFDFEVIDGTIQLGAPRIPAGEPKVDESFGETEVFYSFVEVEIPFSRSTPDETPVALNLFYRGCKEDSICYPQQSQDLSLLLKASSEYPAGTPTTEAPISEQDRLANLIINGSIPLVLASFFGFGLLLAFTPCVLPMVPILSSIIAGEGDNVSTARGFWLSFAYVMGMAVTYTAAGALAALAGGQVQALFQQPWVLSLFAGLFVVLALAMFGLFDLQMPSFIQSKLSSMANNQKGGTVVGTVIMGALSALIVTTCVAPALVATLAVIGPTGDVARGAAALFAMSLGMGAPLLLVGASAGTLLPKVGPWMNTVKAGFGVMMLGLAIWMLERVLPGGIILALWAALVFLTGVVLLGAFDPLTPDATGGRRFAKGTGLLACLYGAVLLIGATLGGTSPLSPIPKNFVAASGSTAGEAAGKLPFVEVATVSDFEAKLSDAARRGQRVMLDFTADWCVSCKEMEAFTFSKPEVASALDDWLLLKADVTENDEEDQALLKRFGIFGPPTIAFFDPTGGEQKGMRLVGYVPADDFVAHVERAESLPTPLLGAAQ